MYVCIQIDVQNWHGQLLCTSKRDIDMAYYTQLKVQIDRSIQMGTGGFGGLFCIFESMDRLEK